MNYIGTRGENAVSGAEAILNGLGTNGGLYVPETFPRIENKELRAWADLDYPTLAARVLEKYLPEAGFETLLDITTQAAAKFCVDEVTPLVKVDDNTYVLELWHGPTHAFKDVALTTLPLLLAWAKREQNVTDETLVLVATSGDTGKAALEGFKDIDGVRVTVLYPSEGVSPLQKLQMTTQSGRNVNVLGIQGNFDDAQSAVKEIFSDKAVREELKQKGIALASANSINLGRLLPQVVYYFSAYFDLANVGEIEWGQEISFSVPTGNFGDILAGYYAKRMGLPVAKLICASNMNNVLTDFLESGEYDAVRPFFKTMSPSMDILISSNLERLLFEAAGRDGDRIANLMNQLKSSGIVGVREKELAFIRETFAGQSASEEDTADEIEALFADDDYLLDPHTAVAAFAADAYLYETGDVTTTVILSTASPYKFVGDVLRAIGEVETGDLRKDLENLEALSALELPATLKELPSLPVRFSKVLAKEEIKAAILSDNK